MENKTFFEKLIDQWGRENIVCIYNVDGIDKMVSVVQVNPDKFVMNFHDSVTRSQELSLYMLEVWLNKGFIKIYGRIA